MGVLTLYACVFRLFLPLFLVIGKLTFSLIPSAALIRYNLFSCVYLLFLLILAILPCTKELKTKPCIRDPLHTEQDMENAIHESNVDHIKQLTDKHRRRIRNAWIADTLCKLSSMVVICLTSIAFPSLPSLIYLLVFLGMGTHWACKRESWANLFNGIRFFLAVYSGLHIFLFYLYQFPFFQSFCPNGSFAARLLGLNTIVQTSCDRPGELKLITGQKAEVYLAPIFTLILYHVMVWELRRQHKISVMRRDVFGGGSQEFVCDFLRWWQSVWGGMTSSQEPFLFTGEEVPEIFFEQIHSSHNRVVALFQTSISRLYSKTDASVKSNTGSSTIQLHRIATSTDQRVDIAPSTSPINLQSIPKNEHNDNRTLPSKTSPASTKNNHNPSNFFFNPTTIQSNQLLLGSTPCPVKSSVRGDSAVNDSSATTNRTCIDANDGDLDINGTLAGSSSSNLHEHRQLSSPDALQEQQQQTNASNATTSQHAPPFDAMLGFTPPFASYIYGAQSQRPLLLSLNDAAIRNSYIFTLIAMMAWAVIYRGWLSFVLLLTACLLWIMPKSRAACLFCSPIIVLYAVVLILLQYVYQMNLTESELPTTSTPQGPSWSELGLKRWKSQMGGLGWQIVFLCCFWLTLRLFIIERSVRNRNLSRHSSTPLNSHFGVIRRRRRNRRSPWWFSFTGHPADLPLVSRTPNLHHPRRRPSRGGSTDDDGGGHAEDDDGDYDDFEIAWFGTLDHPLYKRLTSFLHRLCVKYWIVACCLSMLLVSIQQPVVLFRIVYMVMLTYFLLVFQLSYRFWRRQMLVFWWVCVLYSMVMLLCIYTYQFTRTQQSWESWTGLSRGILRDIGLETYESTGLFPRLMNPLIFLVMIILQVHYFHPLFMRASSLYSNSATREGTGGTGSSIQHLTTEHHRMDSNSQASDTPNFIEDVNSMFHVVWAKLASLALSLQNSFWRFLEVHWIKVIGLLLFVTAVNDVASPQLIVLFTYVLLFPFKSMHHILVTIIYIFTASSILCKMCFQLNIVDISNRTVSCISKNGTVGFDKNAAWFGLTEVDNFRSYILNQTLLFVTCVVWYTILYRQRKFYHQSGTGQGTGNKNAATINSGWSQPPSVSSSSAATATDVANRPVINANIRPRDGIIFPDVKIHSLTTDVTTFVKFLFNYAFYKCGLELCYCVTIITACLRADVLSVVYLIFLLFFLFTPRHICARAWPYYLGVLGLLIPLQYLLCIGQLPSMCWTPPWITSSPEMDNLLQWLLLPGEYGSLVAKKLIPDFFQFTAVALQYNVFNIESRPDSSSYGGGSNEPVINNWLPKPSDRDFVSYKESYLDYLRHVVFYWSYWISLAVVLATSVNWITLFCLGYMLLSFIYLWMGQNVMLNDRRNLIKSWNFVIGYNLLVILSKCSLQLAGCVFWRRVAHYCWILQLFGIHCINPFNWHKYRGLVTVDSSCQSVTSGLHWDVICFIFIIFQRKIFFSESFGFVLLDLQIQTKFASSGAYLINSKLMKEIAEQDEKEKMVLQRIQQKLDVIQKPFGSTGLNTDRITEHYIMLRSGYYQMFETPPDSDEDDSTVDGMPPDHERSHPPFDSGWQQRSRPGIPYTLSTSQLPDHGRLFRGGASSQDHQRYYQSMGANNSGIGGGTSDATSSYPSYGVYLQDGNVVIPTSFELGHALGHRRLRSNPEYPVSQRPASSTHYRPTAANTLGHGRRLFTIGPCIDEDGSPATALIARRRRPVSASRQQQQQQARNADDVQASDDSQPQQPTAKLPTFSVPSRLGGVGGSGTFRLSQQPATSRQLEPTNEASTSRQPPPDQRAKEPVEDDDYDELEAEEEEEDYDDVANPSRSDSFADIDVLQLLYEFLGLVGVPTTSASSSRVHQPRGSRHQPSSSGRGSAVAAGPANELIGRLSASRQPGSSITKAPVVIQSDETAATGRRRRSATSRMQSTTGDNRYRIRLEPPPPIDRSKSFDFDLTQQTRSIKNQSNWKRSKTGSLSGTPLLAETEAEVYDEGEPVRQVQFAQQPLRLEPTGSSFDYDRESCQDPSPPTYSDDHGRDDDSQQPRDDDVFKQEEKDDEESPDTRNENCWSKVKASCRLLLFIFETAVANLIKWLNLRTKKYRIISGKIDKRKCDHKRRTIEDAFKGGENQQSIHQDDSSTELQSITPGAGHRPSVATQSGGGGGSVQRLFEWDSVSLPPDNRTTEPSLKPSTDPVTHVSDSALARQRSDAGGETGKAFLRQRSKFFLLLMAIGKVAVVYSEWFCYSLMILNHMRSANILSLVYPLSVFLWGMLSVPRPTKTYWIFLITYTEIVIAIKYIFQFKFINFNDPSKTTDAMWLPLVCGIEKNEQYGLLDLVLLIALFLHRGYLKNNGLWRDHVEFKKDLEKVENKEGKHSRRDQRPRKGVQSAVRAHSSYSRHVGEQQLRLSSREPSRLQSSAIVNSTNNNALEPLSRTSRMGQQQHSPSLLSVELQLPPSAIGGVNGSDRRLSSAVVATDCGVWNPFTKLRRFYIKMTDARYNKKVDVYIFMFLFEFISLWIIIFGYVSFGPSTGMADNAFDFIKSNKIPLPFISMLLVQFLFIITDRGLFLRKQVLGKFIFLVMHVFLIHGWLFFVLPNITKTRFTSGSAPQLLYITKCIYFSLSAYQIRSGYPKRILGNFLTKGYGYTNMILFKAYLIIPFLYELRNVMDWMWTNSALSLYHWMELEDVYTKLFVLKCWRRSEVAYPTPRGESRPAWKKLLCGGLLLGFFFICFWGPMTLSSFIGVTYMFNPPTLCQFSLSFGGFPPAFEFVSREGNILNVTKDAYKKFVSCYDDQFNVLVRYRFPYTQHTIGFLNNFEVNDLRLLTINGFSGNIWAITRPSFSELVEKLSDPSANLLIHFFIQCRRQVNEIQTSQVSVEDIFSRKLTPQEKSDLHSLITTTNHSDNSADNHDGPQVLLNGVFPRYLLLGKDRLRPAYAALGDPQTYANVSFIIHRDTKRDISWWKLKAHESRDLHDCYKNIGHLTKTSEEGQDDPESVLSILTFNERVSSSLFGKVFNNYGRLEFMRNTYTNQRSPPLLYSIIGMYAAYIFLANRLLRTIYTHISYVIAYEELPYVDRLLNLCNEIYLVREHNQLRLEELLVSKLFFLYRSSETMIRWTRHPKKLIDKFTDKSVPGATTNGSEASLEGRAPTPTSVLRHRRQGPDNQDDDNSRPPIVSSSR